MSQRAVEAVLGRLITDVQFRSRFFADAAEVCRENDIVLTPRETRALLEVSVAALNGLTAELDPKIVRAALGSAVRSLDHVDTTGPRGGRVARLPVPGLPRE